MKEQPVIAVIGAGALGVMFGQRMTQTLGPQRVFFAADAQRAARYAAQSFTCNGAACTLPICDAAAGAACRSGGLRRQKYRACRRH